jgi:hypothetical protein
VANMSTSFAPRTRSTSRGKWRMRMQHVCVKIDG